MINFYDIINFIKIHQQDINFVLITSASLFFFVLSFYKTSKGIQKKVNSIEDIYNQNNLPLDTMNKNTCTVVSCKTPIDNILFNYQYVLSSYSHFGIRNQINLLNSFKEKDFYKIENVDKFYEIIKYVKKNFTYMLATILDRVKDNSDKNPSWLFEQHVKFIIEDLNNLQKSCSRFILFYNKNMRKLSLEHQECYFDICSTIPRLNDDCYVDIKRIQSTLSKIEPSKNNSESIA